MKKQESPYSHDVQEWCLGLPRVGERRLTVQEERQMRDELRFFARQSWKWVGAAPLLLIAAIVPAAAASEVFGQREIIQVALTVVVILCTFLFPALLLLRGNDFWKQSKTTKKELRDGCLVIYAAVPSEIWSYGKDHKPDEHPSDEKYENEETQISGVEVALEERVSLEVFAASRRLWSVNGKRAQDLTILPAVEVAPVPQQSRTAKVWAQDAPKNLDGSYDIANAPRRDLSAAEREELRRNARAVWRRPAFSAFLFSAWIGLPLVACLVTNTPPKPEMSAYFIGAVALFCNYIFLQKSLLAARWARDARAGFVLVLQIPDEKNPQTATALEMLPSSRWWWTINGHFAPWRMESQ